MAAMAMVQSIQNAPRLGTRERLPAAIAPAEGSMLQDAFSP